MNSPTHCVPPASARVKSRLRWLVGVVGAALAICSSAQAAPGDPPPDAKLDPALRYALTQATDTSTVRVIIHTTTGSVAPVRAHIQATGNVVSAEHPFIGAV